MKSTALFISVAILTSTQVFSQKTLPSRVQPYAENWTYTLVKSLNRAGFEMPTMPAASIPANQISARSTLQLDSIKTFYAYNGNGAGDSLPFLRTIYQYLQPKVITETNYQYDNGEWITLHRSTITNDDQQRLVEISTEAFDRDNQTFRPDSKLQIFPRGNSAELTDSLFGFTWDASILQWKSVFSIHYTFDGQNRLQETISKIDDWDKQGTYKALYYYDNNGDNYMIREFDVVDNQEKFSGRTDIVYVDHRPIEVLNWIVDSLDFRPKSRSNHAYTLFGAIRRTNNFQYDWDTETWRVFQTVTYLYDQSERLASKQTDTDYLNIDGNRELILYAYTDANYPTQETLFYWNEDAFEWELDSRKYYYYNGSVSTPPPPKPVQSIKVAPNPSTGTIQFSLDQEAAVRVFDARGQLVFSQIMQAGMATIDLTHFPSGAYTLIAQQGTDVFLSKVIKA